MHNTSWANVGKWYARHIPISYFHEHVVIPGTLRLLDLHPGDSLLDLACGEGVLGRSIPDSISYTGIDSALNLIRDAKQKDHHHTYVVGDVTKPIDAGMFTHVVVMLALQNIEFPDLVIKNIKDHLVADGKLVLVLNHPCFRIPRQSSWEIDQNNKLQYRRVNRYLSPLSIPITMHPGQKTSPVTWSFHRSLSDYFFMLNTNGFVVDGLEEWVSDRESEGKASKMENRSRAEIPMFMAIRAVAGNYSSVGVRYL